jgi:hypothetical protein
MDVLRTGCSLMGNLVPRAAGHARAHDRAAAAAAAAAAQYPEGESVGGKTRSMFDVFDALTAAFGSILVRRRGRATGGRAGRRSARSLARRVSPRA